MSNTFDSPDRRWVAVQARNPAAAMAFVYAVHTTQIFCRPTCPARLARRANVTFYNDAPSASAAGFRPCKRCKPTDDEAFHQHSNVQAAAIHAQKIIHSTNGTATWKNVCKEVGVSPRYLHNAFRTAVGITPGAYARLLRSDTALFESAPAETETKSTSACTPLSGQSTISGSGEAVDHTASAPSDTPFSYEPTHTEFDFSVWETEAIEIGTLWSALSNEHTSICLLPRAELASETVDPRTLSDHLYT